MARLISSNEWKYEYFNRTFVSLLYSYTVEDKLYQMSIRCQLIVKCWLSQQLVPSFMVLMTTYPTQCFLYEAREIMYCTLPMETIKINAELTTAELRLTSIL